MVKLSTLNTRPCVMLDASGYSVKSKVGQRQIGSN
jgi:hypothetical protein